MLIVGDTVVDILCGQQLKMYTVGVLCGMRDRKFLKNIGPDFLIENMPGYGGDWMAYR